MFVKKIILTTVVFILSPIFWTEIWASDKNIELRLERLERMIQHNSSVKVLAKIQVLQNENQQLRSQLEELIFQHDKLKVRIHALNEDMDRRVTSLESSSTTDVAIPPAKDFDDQEAEESQGSQTLDNDTLEQQIKEQKAYEDAFNQLKAQRYGKAESSFNAFLSDFPSSSYAALAQYWLAESSYAQRNFKRSIEYYSDLLSQYKESHKRIESHLKIAYCYYELGDRKMAKSRLNSLINKYPNSTEAGQAKRLLKKLK